MDLQRILIDIQSRMANKDHDALIKDFVNKRLIESLKSYYDELDKAQKYASYRDEMKVIKKINGGRQI